MYFGCFDVTSIADFRGAMSGKRDKICMTSIEIHPCEPQSSQNAKLAPAANNAVTSGFARVSEFRVQSSGFKVQGLGFRV